MFERPQLSPETLAKWEPPQRPRSQMGEQEFILYEISEDPLPDPLFESFSRTDQARILDVLERFQEGDRTSLVAELEALLAEFPEFPKLYNHLAIAYQAAGRDADYRRVTLEMYERFPDYLFGIINRAQLAVEEGRIDDVPAIFRYTLRMDLLFGGRKDYHVSEIVAWQSFFCRYFAETGDVHVANQYLEAVNLLIPDHPVVEELAQRVMLAFVRHIPEMFPLQRRPRKKTPSITKKAAPRKATTKKATAKKRSKPG